MDFGTDNEIPRKSSLWGVYQNHLGNFSKISVPWLCLKSEKKQKSWRVNRRHISEKDLQPILRHSGLRSMALKHQTVEWMMHISREAIQKLRTGSWVSCMDWVMDKIGKAILATCNPFFLPTQKSFFNYKQARQMWL